VSYSKIILLVVVATLALFLYKRSADTRKVAAENSAVTAKFLAENARDSEVITTASGLQYKVLRAGTGTVKPTADDTVKVHYHGTLINGTVFDSSVQRGEPIEFGLTQVIKGWTEGLQLMVVGEKTRLFIPAELGYGNRGVGPIPPGSLLIFDVELLAINGQS
jgi:peptidylprolyl isomerase